MNTRNALNNTSHSGVKRQEIQNLEIFSKKGGYVFNAVYNIMPDVPPQNIVAMFEAVREFSL